MQKFQSFLIKFDSMITPRIEQLVFLFVLLYVLLSRLIAGVTTYDNVPLNIIEYLGLILLFIIPIILLSFSSLYSYVNGHKWVAYLMIFIYFVSTRTRFIPWVLAPLRDMRLTFVADLLLGTLIFLYLALMLVMIFSRHQIIGNVTKNAFMVCLLVGTIITTYAFNGFGMLVYFTILATFLYYKGRVVEGYLLLMIIGLFPVVGRFRLWILFGFGNLSLFAWLSFIFAGLILVFAIYGYLRLKQPIKIKSILASTLNNIKPSKDTTTSDTPPAS